MAKAEKFRREVSESKIDTSFASAHEELMIRVSITRRFSSSIYYRL